MLRTTLELEAVRRVCLRFPEGRTEAGVPYADLYEVVRIFSFHSDKVDFNLFDFPPALILSLVETWRADIEREKSPEAASAYVVQMARFFAVSALEGPYRMFPTTPN